MVADTAWALPWRATPEQVADYARDRHDKGFTAALLMSVQPDMDARGPENRRQDEGFDMGFAVLSAGQLTALVPEYFQRLDRLISILLDHEIVSLLVPVFSGYGWEGMRAFGAIVDPAQLARYSRYLVARYGASPLIYLVSANGDGRAASVPAAGLELGAWDTYSQPNGIHYQPHTLSSAWQAEDWLHFQWCQTGHDGEHVPQCVADTWRTTRRRP